MNRFLSACWFVYALTTTQAFTQNPQTARLKQELAAAKTDTSRVLLLADISASYRYSRFDSSLAYAQRGLALAERIHYRKGEGRCLTRMGYLNFERGNLPQAFRQSLRALQLNEESGDWHGMVQTLNGLGIIYLRLEDYSQSRGYLFRGKAIGEQKKIKDDTDLIILLCNIGNTYLLQNRLDSAQFFLQRSYQLTNRSTTIRRSSRGNPMTFVLRDLGRIQAQLARPEQALSYYRGAIQASQVENDRRSAAWTFQAMAEAYQTMNHPDSSVFYARKALAASQAMPIMNGILGASTLLGKLYKSQGQSDSALKYMELAMVARDSLFNQQRVQELQGANFNEQRRLRRVEAERERFESQVKIYALLSGLVVLLLGAVFLWSTNRQQQRANALLHQQKQEIEQQRATAEKTLAELKTTQTQLIQSEKMASLGELTAGIAHEIQNPLNFVNNFSEVSAELVGELREESIAGNHAEVMAITDDLTQNLEKIAHHGQRASSIVRGMLEHARTSTGERQATNLNALADEARRLSYHGLRAKDNSFNTKLVTNFDETLNSVSVIPQDLSRVFLNLFNNAFYAVSEKKKQLDPSFQPEVSVMTKQMDDALEIRVRDNGNGIPEAVLEKIFQPFFTTKPAGQGTGLGLSLSYDIVTKGHGGTLTATTREGEFTEFVVTLPTTVQQPAATELK